MISYDQKNTRMVGRPQVTASVNFEESNDFNNLEDLDFSRTVTTANNMVIPPTKIQFANEMDI
jgi:hypothetical protein